MEFVVGLYIAGGLDEFSPVGFGDGVSPRQDGEGVEGFHLRGCLREAGPLRVHTAGHRMVEGDGGPVEAHALPADLVRNVAGHAVGQLVDLQTLLVDEGEREKELTELERKLSDRKDEFEGYADRVKSYDSGEKYLQKIDETIVNEPEYQLPEPPKMMSAKSYKAKFVDPLIKKLKSLLTTIVARYLEIMDERRRTLAQYNSLYRENEDLRYENNQLKSENTELRKQNRQYSFLRKVFGEKGLEDLIQKAEEIKQAKMREKRNKKYER